MSAEQQMFFIRNMRALGSESAPRAQTREFMLITDAGIVGAFEYGPYAFSVWEISPDKRPGEERWLSLRIRQVQEPAHPRTATKQAYYHGGGIAAELALLASLFLRRRIRLGPVVRWDDKPLMINVPSGPSDPEIMGGQTNLSDLRDWFPLAENLHHDVHQRFILATKLYQQALLLIDSSPDLAYLNLVSSIEVLAEGYDIGPVPLSDLDANLASLVARIEDPEVKQRLERAILSRELLISRRFIGFILAHVDETFWTHPGRPQIGRIDPDQLPELLKRVYGQRSRALHKGEPFPPDIYGPPVHGEIFSALGLVNGQRAWEPEDFVPHPSFFERLVNHVLRNFLRRNQSAQEAS